MSAAQSLRQLLERPGLLIAPGAYDGIGARLIEQAGFHAAYMTGAGRSAARGYPDFGLLTMTEMVEDAAVMARSIGIPLIADADTGYGNELNVRRCVRAYEERGIASIHIEDQVAPKRCGHLDGKEIIPRDQFVSKIRAAVEARQTTSFVIIARTDSRAVVSLEEAVWRANAALDVGADMAFVEAPQSMDETAAIPRLVHGPCMINVVPTGRTPMFPLGHAEEMGYKLAILPGLLLSAAIEACDRALETVRRTGNLPETASDLFQMFRRFGADEWDDVRRRYGAGTSMGR